VSKNAIYYIRTYTRGIMGSKLYRIICLKRSIIADKYFVYWLPNRRGYTDKKAQAGVYTGLDLEECAGHEGDYYITPLSFSEMGGYRL